MKRILGIDWGDKKMGVSVSDLLHITASGVGVFYGDKEEKMNKIEELIKKYDVEEIVLGFPISLSGEIENQGKKILEIKDEMEKRFKIKIELIDERFTSKISKDKFLYEKKKGLKIKQKKVEDDLSSAIIILNSYLSRLK
ncbi:MAG TPA: Holliday junction resolvase RuvX [Caldisericia bacterium]|nr:Holliday junction resolvase RuvX [Caldisericia bacterium]HOL82406.1 Holliday junction resolvase RuvX [Caldisericia bacterium]HON83612.1 Holliday junction resolvase RuvX [Caldisericia bacterium]HPC56439.1 Holliday junction resolvase RuvX [Caldisericia bacterium]HPP43153.1 Holliday junction resolvase RuvX [Caldisericia bacterium]